MPAMSSFLALLDGSSAIWRGARRAGFAAEPPCHEDAIARWTLM